jgi:hypothetical protein
VELAAAALVKRRFLQALYGLPDDHTTSDEVPTKVVAAPNAAMPEVNQMADLFPCAALKWIGVDNIL